MNIQVIKLTFVHIDVSENAPQVSKNSIGHIKTQNINNLANNILIFYQN